MTKSTVPISDSTFDKTVGEGLTVVDFWAEWCGPCHVVAPTLEELAGEYSDRVTVAKLNVDENPTAAQAYEIMSIPTLVFFKDGEEVKRLVGARPKAELESEIEALAA